MDGRCAGFGGEEDWGVSPRFLLALMQLRHVAVNSDDSTVLGHSLYQRRQITKCWVTHRADRATQARARAQDARGAAATLPHLVAAAKRSSTLAQLISEKKDAMYAGRALRVSM